MNKIIVLQLICTFLTYGNTFSQCIVEAGVDRNICLEEQLNGVKLFGEVVSGDVTELKWESIYYASELDETYYASSMLSDTLILEPTLEQHFERTVKFYLTGMTSLQETCIDSVVINFSDWTFLTIDKATGKTPLDTVELWIAAESNWPHKKYEWSPNYMISDTTIENPKVWNDTTVFYNLIITDSLGCSVTDDIFEVYVNSTSINEIDENDLYVYPNPTSGRVNIYTKYQIESYKLFDLTGKLLKSSNVMHIDIENENDGVYILQLKSISGELICKKIVKKNTP